MTDPTAPGADDRPLRLVTAAQPSEPSPVGDEVTDLAGESRDPLLARAERIAELPLAERPAAFDGLNRAVVAELNTLDEG